jgi:hypothetical protein
MDPWTRAMHRGDFAAAWRISDACLVAREPQRSSEPRHLQCVWDGRALDGKRVLVRCYHGLGDTLQFVRLLPLLRERAKHVVLWAQPALLGLLATAHGFDRVEPLHDGEPGVERDVDIELMELAHALRITAETLPVRVPYLRVAPVEPRVARARPRVGLAWRSGDWDAARSIPDALLAPLAAADVEWCSLQFGIAPPPFAAHDLACADLVEQARRIAALDLVISVDTMTAHLAGALGVRVWTLLPEPCDWRWMQRRDDTPWYPTMRLFRQRRPGDWHGVIARVLDALSAERTILA